MRAIRDLHAAARAAGRPAISFEFFPPKTEEGARVFFEQTLPALTALSPDYCSVTYGAGGGTRETTLETVDRIQRQFGIPTIMHLTCVNHTRAELRGILDAARARGVRNVLALRGDPPVGGAFQVVPDGLAHAAELVALVREAGGFDVAVAGFPEGHIACPEGREVDWTYLIAKIEAGAHAVITQLFFDNADYFALRDFLAHRGISVPVIPGLLPVISRSQTHKFVTMCGAKLPGPFLEQIEALGDDNAAVTDFGVEYCTQQCVELLREGAPGIHFFTLNKVYSTVQILRNLGWSGKRPKPPAGQVSTE